MGKIKITCKEASIICSKAQYGEASFLDKMRLKAHFVYCKVCKIFSQQNSELSNICVLTKKYQETHKCCLSIEEKERLKEQIKQELKKQE